LNASYRILAVVCVVMLIAIATFEDRFALTIGTLGLVAAAIVLAIIVLGAGLSLRRQSAGSRRIDLSVSSSVSETEGDPGQPRA